MGRTPWCMCLVAVGPNALICKVRNMASDKSKLKVNGWIRSLMVENEKSSYKCRYLINVITILVVVVLSLLSTVIIIIIIIITNFYIHAATEKKKKNKNTVLYANN